MNMRSFGTTTAGEVHELTIRNAYGMEARILTLGAALRSLTVFDEEGQKRDIVLGYDTAEAYSVGSEYFGATVGRCCNRIAGPDFELDGKNYPLVLNEGGNQLHGGPFGFSRQIWMALPLGESEAAFRLYSSDGDMGFPGNVSVQVTYRLTEDSLIIEYEAESDAPTLMNLTNHSYFNLSGHDSGSVASHRLRLNADLYTPTGPDLIPSGEIRSVKGSCLDLREGRLLGEILEDAFLSATQGLDHNFVLTGDKDLPFAVLSDPEEKIVMEAFTDRPAVQIYTAGGLRDVRGKDGALYQSHQGICLETQGFPDAVHHKDFPSVVLPAGEKWHSKTQYRFKGFSRIRRKKPVMIWV